MNTFIGSVSLPNNTPTTLADLIRAAITARTTYATAAQETADINRYDAAGLPGPCCVRPAADVYIMNPFKATMVAGDFTSAPGGAVLQANVPYYFHDGLPGNVTFFQASGSAVTIHLI